MKYTCPFAQVLEALGVALIDSPSGMVITNSAPPAELKKKAERSRPLFVRPARSTNRIRDTNPFPA